MFTIYPKKNLMPTVRSVAPPRTVSDDTCAALLKVPHLMIAGSTGAGKSVLINAMLAHLLSNTRPDEARLVLIDPKKVELFRYADLPGRVIDYADEAEGAAAALEDVVTLMMRRYEAMRADRVRSWPGGQIYVVIDEYADLVITGRKQIEPLIIRISQLGRAAGVHLIIATQRPTADIINGAIKTNIDHRVALHVAGKQHSRNIIEDTGAETLRIGEALYYTPFGIRQLCDLPMIPDEVIDGICDYWSGHIPVVEDQPRRA